MEQKNQLVILRGISGSGKSTLAKEIIKECGLKGDKDSFKILSTDDFFMNDQGEYLFNPGDIGHAHEWNQRRACKAMEKGVKLIIIDNTNTQKWEAKPYVESGLKNNYEITFREPDTPWARDAKELAKRNRHNVPIKNIVRMLKRWENDFTVENIMRAHEPKKQRKVAPQQKRIGIIQVKLNDEDRKNLEVLCPSTFEKRFGAHVTLAFKPKKADMTKILTNSIGEGTEVNVHVDLLVISKNYGIEALRVAKMETSKDHLEVISLNSVPHITLSLDPQKRKPVDSNTLLKMKLKDIETKDMSVVVKGKIFFTYFN